MKHYIEKNIRSIPKSHIIEKMEHISQLMQDINQNDIQNLNPYHVNEASSLIYQNFTNLGIISNQILNLPKKNLPSQNIPNQNLEYVEPS